MWMTDEPLFFQFITHCVTNSNGFISMCYVYDYYYCRLRYMNECVTCVYDVIECFLFLPNRLTYLGQSFIHFCYLIILNKFDTAFDTFEN